MYIYIYIYIYSGEAWAGRGGTLTLGRPSPAQHSCSQTVATPNLHTKIVPTKIC